MHVLALPTNPKHTSSCCTTSGGPSLSFRVVETMVASGEERGLLGRNEGGGRREERGLVEKNEQHWFREQPRVRAVLTKKFGGLLTKNKAE